MGTVVVLGIRFSMNELACWGRGERRSIDARYTKFHSSKAEYPNRALTNARFPSIPRFKVASVGASSLN